MTRRLRVPVPRSLAEYVERLAAGSDVTVSEWCRDVWRRRSSRRYADQEERELYVRVDEDLAAAIDAAAARSGMSASRWLRLALGAELRSLLLED